jgi:hypothetical protein
MEDCPCSVLPEDLKKEVVLVSAGGSANVIAVFDGRSAVDRRSKPTGMARRGLSERGWPFN